MSDSSSGFMTANGLAKTYHRGEVAVRALQDVDICIRRGDFSVLCGPSGSGKSTLLNLLGLLEPPDHGRLSINGSEVAFAKEAELDRLRARYMGFVFQQFNLIPVLTALENVELPLYEGRLGAQARRGKAAELLKTVGLAERMHHRPSQLSGGQQQRVAVARALVRDPLIVFADEPTANLDSTTSETLLDLMRQLNRDHGTAFIIATHDPRVVARADRVIHMADGVIAS